MVMVPADEMDAGDGIRNDCRRNLHGGDAPGGIMVIQLSQSRLGGDGDWSSVKSFSAHNTEAVERGWAVNGLAYQAKLKQTDGSTAIRPFRH